MWQCGASADFLYRKITDAYTVVARVRRDMGDSATTGAWLTKFGYAGSWGGDLFGFAGDDAATNKYPVIYSGGKTSAGKDAEWIPLIAGKTASGTEVVGAAVIRYHGDRKGAAVLCSLYGTDGIWGTNSEENQAKFTARGAALAFAEGVQAYFPYVLRAYEDDPFYSEDHFGLMHADFQPKPAYSAYANFAKERPEGSVNRPGEWHDAERTAYYPQWKRPDGKIGGVVWRVAEPTDCILRFKDGEPQLRNIYGCKLHVRRLDAGDYRLMLGDSHVYFSGAELVSVAVNGSKRQ